MFFIFYQKNFKIRYLFFIPKFIFPLIFSKNIFMFLVPSFFIKKQLFFYIKKIQDSFIIKEMFYYKINFSGLGYRFELIDKIFIKIYLNNSHYFYFYIPFFINVKALDNHNLLFSSYNKNKLAVIVQKIVKLKKLNLFKNKGLFFYNL